MTNHLVGDVYARIIEDVIAASTNSFEESGVSQATLQELQQTWQAKLSLRGIAQMPWDPKPAPPAPVQASPPPPAIQDVQGGVDGYPYDPQTADGTRSKQGPNDPQFNGMSNGYQQPAPPPPPQGGFARAQQLVQQYSGQNVQLNARPQQQPQSQAQLQQQQRVGLALPGQQGRPQGLQLPGGAPAGSPLTAPLQQPLNGSPLPAEIKVETSSPRLDPTIYQSNPNQPPSALPQTDGADDGLDEWKALLAQRRALDAEHTQRREHLMRTQVARNMSSLESGLMVPLASGHGRVARVSPATMPSSSAEKQILLTDGADDDVKEEDDENAINSDLDDSDEDEKDQMGDDDDDNGDSILCTYDKVQRVKNKWKCVLKDGVMSVGGKEYVFHKCTGEYEW